MVTASASAPDLPIDPDTCAPLESGDNHNYSSSSEDENSVHTSDSDTGGYTCTLMSISMIFTSTTFHL